MFWSQPLPNILLAASTLEIPGVKAECLSELLDCPLHHLGSAAATAADEGTSTAARKDAARAVLGAAIVAALLEMPGAGLLGTMELGCLKVQLGCGKQKG